jgi:hypothetical protein
MSYRSIQDDERTYCGECGHMVTYTPDELGFWVCDEHGETIECSECGQSMDDDHDGIHDDGHGLTRFTLTVDMGNAAFEDLPRGELARILRVQADKLENSPGTALDHVYYPGHSETILDVNGNDVGRGKLHQD